MKTNSINSVHTYNAIVYIKDIDARVGVLQLMHELGYEFTAGKSYSSLLRDEWKWDYDMISNNPVILVEDEYIGICGCDKSTDEEILAYINDREKIRAHFGREVEREYVCCGFNKELFKAVIMIRNDRDDNQYYVERNNPNRADNIKFLTQWKHFPEDCTIEWCIQYLKKATLDDLKEFLDCE